MVEFVPTGDLKQKFFFNVSTPVGAGAKGSSRADILLVQYYFVLRRGSPAGDPEAYQKVKLTGVCDDALIAAIRAYQASHADRLVQDGLVSRAQGARFSAGAGWRYWSIIGMNFTFWIYLRSLWPRIDRFPKCNGELGQVIRDALGASPSV